MESPLISALDMLWWRAAAERLTAVTDVITCCRHKQKQPGTASSTAGSECMAQTRTPCTQYLHSSPRTMPTPAGIVLVRRHPHTAGPNHLRLLCSVTWTQAARRAAPQRQRAGPEHIRVQKLVCVDGGACVRCHDRVWCPSMFHAVLLASLASTLYHKSRVRTLNAVFCATAPALLRGCQPQACTPCHHPPCVP